MTRLQGEIVAEVSILMNTGSATTAIAMTDVLYQLVKNPKTLEKLIEQIDDALNEEEDQPKDGVIPCDKVKYLPYLRAGLDESLRLFPTTLHGLPREIPPDGTQEAFLLLCLPSSRTGSIQNFPERIRTFRSGGWEKRANRSNLSS
ncbi:hypothetical protein HBI44_076760 [Parastagonospora nodorum]|nr:hypothetical protein HBH52_047570 [Parastagonospora nodorum]KAH5698548.1 hypothetical protein HBI44_076760 [Parastagonospora nodorum]